MSNLFMEQIKKAQQKDIGAPLFEVGQTVRVLSTLTVNMPASCSHWLGAECIVLDAIKRGLLSPEWCYELSHPEINVICEFKADELDMRYRLKNKKPSTLA